MYILPSGYRVWQPLPQAQIQPGVVHEAHESYEFINVLNTGGTITSMPRPGATLGVQAGVHALNPQTRLGAILTRERLGAVEILPKNSEHYTWQDYVVVLDRLSSLIRQGHRRWIVLHGTDNASFFGVLLAIMARASGGRLVLTFCQRSMDRPSWQGEGLILAAKSLLNHVRQGQCLALSHHDGTQFRIHAPVELRKIHTTRKACMESTHMTLWRPGDPVHKPRYRIPAGVDWRNPPRREAIQYLTPLTTQTTAAHVIGYGTGNAPPHLQDRLVGTRVPAGPYHCTLYGGRPAPDPQLSTEARYLYRVLS